MIIELHKFYDILNHLLKINKEGGDSNMLRDACLLNQNSKFLISRTLGNRSPETTNNYEDADLNTIEFHFKKRDYDNKGINNYFNITISSTYGFSDNSGHASFDFKLDGSDSEYWSVTCTNICSEMNFHITVDRTRFISDNLLVVKFINIKDKDYNVYQFVMFSLQNIFTLHDIKVYKTDNYLSLNTMCIPGIRYISSDYITSSPDLQSFGCTTCVNENNTWVFCEKQGYYTQNKSIAIPRWCNYIVIETTAVNVFDNTGVPVATISYDHYNNLERNIPLYSINHNNNNSSINSESNLIYDGKDLYYRYYHVQSSAFIDDNLIKITGSVKKKFRTKSNILSHLLIKYNKKEVA